MLSSRNTNNRFSFWHRIHFWNQRSRLGRPEFSYDVVHDSTQLGLIHDSSIHQERDRTLRGTSTSQKSRTQERDFTQGTADLAHNSTLPNQASTEQEIEKTMDIARRRQNGANYVLKSKRIISSYEDTETSIRSRSSFPNIGDHGSQMMQFTRTNEPTATLECGRGSKMDGNGEDYSNYLFGPKQWPNFAPASRACRPTFLFDPAGKFSYYWSMIVSLAFLYNLWVIAYRFSFDEITSITRLRWFCLDYVCDFIYLLDIIVQFRTGFLDEGVLQTNPSRLRIHYTNSTWFYMDLLSLLPLDFLYLSLGYRSILRSFRLTKIYKAYAFVEKTERHTNFPNVLRAILLIHAVLITFHWNACLVYALRGYLIFPNHLWDTEDKFNNYLNAYYLSSRTLIMIDTLPRPKDKSKIGMAFIIGESVFALIIFAAVLGHVAAIVANISAARKQFQCQLDSVKTYMHLRKVPNHLQRKVVRWFDYWWSTKQYGNDGAAMQCLPDKLKAEIAIHVHLDTLKRVEIFRNTEPGFLCELVLKLKPMLFSPGDYVCRKGEVGNEMYIVSIGRLHVLADDGSTVLATLKAGSYFGEISVLNMGTEGNRRTASVVSVGYSDLFCLSKKDIWEVLQDYPTARNRLESIAQKRLHQKLAHKMAMNKSASKSVSTTKFTDESQRRGSAPAVMHSTTIPSDNSKFPPTIPIPNTRQLNLIRPRQSISRSIDIDPSINPYPHRFAPAPAYNRSKRPPNIANSAVSDEASTLYDIDDVDEETMPKSERTQLLKTQSPEFIGQFANDALVLSPDIHELRGAPFIDDITVTIEPDHAKDRKTYTRYGCESQTMF